MALSKDDETKIRDYLLGRLSGDDQEKIEDRLMLEEALFEELEISKGELIDDYRSGQLDQAEHQWFEEHFLATPEGRQKYTFALALDCVKRPNPAPHSPTLFERILEPFKVRPWLTATVTTALIFAIVAAVVIPDRPSTKFATVNLTSTNLSRSEGPQQKRVSLASDVGELRAVLELQQPSVQATGYLAELVNINEEIKPVPVLTHDANKVEVAIPASELPRGRYALKLIAKLADGQEQPLRGRYYFTVE